MTRQYWLMKSEPDVYSILTLKKDKTTEWGGVRNYLARNYMAKEMKVGDEVLFYHSNAEPSGVAGLARVSRAALPDPSQFDKKSEYFDPKATPEKPIWFCVEVKYEKSFPRLVSLPELRAQKDLSEMLLLRKGQRLSILPVTETEFRRVCELGHS